jgi:Protein of unknown function (DUF3054)
MLHRSTTPAATTATQPADAPRVGRVAVLVAGDITAFLLFARAGHAQHHETTALGSIVATAAPFVVAWLVSAPWLGAFGRLGSAATTRPRHLLKRTVIAWIVAWPLALILRAFWMRAGIPLVFDLIALVANAVLLLGWRGVASWLLWRH